MLYSSIASAFEEAEQAGWQQILGAQSVVLTDERFQIFGTLALEAVVEKGPVAEAFAEGQRRIRDLYADYISKHELVGDEVDPMEAATALRALTLGLNIHRRFDGGVISLPQAFDALRSV
ncbi:hypothetical protein BVC93_13690 [Mycobacterium sp. MS1601]|uniref:hypothetical protein n=1 Tax=Mycobacterium sp. MS1601 TaxID=1936029 RepID=UPI0009791B59|nr:hypothetical protein [Mycobacterium sp. MS1601]AQA03293.1 hypothetical protein BVC93_13690 [Mycobacterium sp. MS1601]